MPDAGSRVVLRGRTYVVKSRTGDTLECYALGFPLSTICEWPLGSPNTLGALFACVCVSHPVWLTIVSDVVFRAALDAKDVTVVGFPNAHGTRVQKPITAAAFSYELIEVEFPSDRWHATTITWIKAALQAQGMSPPDCLLFEAGSVKDFRVADALASWRKEEAAPALLPRFRQVNGHMGTAACGGGGGNSDVHGRGRAIARLNTLGAINAARLIGNKEILLYDVNGASVGVEMEHFRLVDYALDNTGNVHYDAPTTDRAPGVQDWEQVQLLVKEGDKVGLIFCCPALEQNLHLSAKTGFAVIMSECILELLGHCAAAASPSRTLVCNGRVPFAQHSFLRGFVGGVFACQTANNHDSVEIDANSDSSASGNTCHPAGWSSWACANGGRANRGTNKNPDLKEYAEWSHRAPYIGIRCVVGGIESELVTTRPIGDSSQFKKWGDTATFLKWSLAAMSNFTGTKGIRAAVAHQLRAAAEQNNKSWSQNDCIRIRLHMSDGNAAKIRDFARPKRWEGLKLESKGVIWNKSLVLSLPTGNQVVVPVEKLTINVTWTDPDSRQGGKKNEAKAAAPNTKNKAVEKRKKSREEIISSDSEECIGVVPAVVAAQSDEANERSSAQAEESYGTNPAFCASCDAMVAGHESLPPRAFKRPRVSVNDQEPGSAKAEAQERDSPAATADPTAIFAEESYWK